MTWPPPHWLAAAEDPREDPRARPALVVPASGFFSAERGLRAVRFIERYCTHTKGRWAGRPFLLIWWQRAVVLWFFGWLRSAEDPRRVFRTLYLELPKKNGKSELAAAVALYLEVADDEPGAEVYSAAADRDQASLVFNVAAQMVRNNPVLLRMLKVLDSVRRVVHAPSASLYRVLSSDVKTKHGLNPSGIIFDELHAQPNRELWDVLTEGTDIARAQQAVWVLTTAGLQASQNVAWQVGRRARKVRDGVLDDASLLPVIFSAQERYEAVQAARNLALAEGAAPADDTGDLWWMDPDLWWDVNPSLGEIFDEENIAKHAAEALADPVRLNAFLRYRLNVWVGAAIRYILPQVWAACRRPEAVPAPGDPRRCWLGMDLSSTTDLTALAAVWEPDAEGVSPVKVWHFLPEDRANQTGEHEDAVPYLAWSRVASLTLTPGNVVDYEFIRATARGLVADYNVQELGYDPWSAAAIAQRMQDEDGMNLVEVRQGYKTLSPPTKELLRLSKSGRLAHDGDPVLRWCVDNLTVTTDAAENVKPAKDKAPGRIDGAVALIIALSRMILQTNTKSVYETRGVRSLRRTTKEA